MDLQRLIRMHLSGTTLKQVTGHEKACLVGSSLIGSLDSIRTSQRLSLSASLDSTAEARNDPGFNEAP